MIDTPILGLDIGGTKLAAAVASLDGSVHAHGETPSAAAEGPEPMIGRLVALARRVLGEAEIGPGDLARVGIACGGPLDPWRGIIRNALNNPGWVDVPIVARIEHALGRPAVLDNDANAAALGEHRFGAGRGCRNLVYLTVSTGVGGGVIADGQLLRGENGNAAELGHLTVDFHGRPCHCGSIGCLEAYASGTNIARRAEERLGVDEVPSSLRDVDRPVRAEDVVAAARAGDALATEIWDETIRVLGAGIASVIHAFNPARVVLGGGVSRADDALFEPLRRVVAERTMPWLHEVVEIVPAALGARSGVLGAVAVALDGGATRPPITNGDLPASSEEEHGSR